MYFNYVKTRFGMTKLQVTLSKIESGLIAQCLGNPEIIVVGKNKTEIKTNLKKIIGGYVIAFPESKNIFFENNKQLAANFIEI